MPRSTALKIKNSGLSLLLRFWKTTFIDQKLNNWVGYIFFPFTGLVLGYLFANHTILGIGILGGAIGLAVAIACFANTEIGLYINLIYSFFAFAFSRFFFNDSFPTGVASDILIVATLFSFFIQKIPLQASLSQFIRTPVVIAILVLFFYLFIELFNPYAHSFDGWYQTFRKSLDSIFLLFIAYKVLDNAETIKRFLTVLFVACTITGIYGCIQEWHGLFGYEIAWATADSNRFGLIFIDGDFRKFSTMSDPTAYGIIMASCGVLFTIIAFNTKKTSTKIKLFIGVAFMFMGMAYSGTRTANAMAAAGFAMFILLTINKKITKIFAVIAALGYLALMYAPYYSNSTINRLRTTFNATNDDSYKVREVNRAFIQPYMWSHPIGGGLCTTGGNGLRFNPSHYLAGFPPDSGYLKKALETGYIGLFIICILYYTVLRNSINGYFEAKNKDTQVIFAGCAACLFSFYIADFAQDAIGQITDTVVYYPVIALTLQLKNICKQENKIIDEANLNFA